MLDYSAQEVENSERLGLRITVLARECLITIAGLLNVRTHISREKPVNRSTAELQFECASLCVEH